MVENKIIRGFINDLNEEMAELNKDRWRAVMMTSLDSSNEHSVLLEREMQ